MMWTQLGWAAGGYLAGTFPSAWIVARAKGATEILTAAGRSSGESDPHILMAKHLGATTPLRTPIPNVNHFSLKRLVNSSIRAASHGTCESSRYTTPAMRG